MNYLPRVLVIIAQGTRRIKDIGFLTNLKIKPNSKLEVMNDSKLEKNDSAQKTGNETGVKDQSHQVTKRLGNALSEGFKKIDQDIKKKRRELEQNVTALNRLVFILVLLGMLISNLSLWIYLNFAL
jgi:CHASE3 domain sensor protein